MWIKRRSFITLTQAEPLAVAQPNRMRGTDKLNILKYDDIQCWILRTDKVLSLLENRITRVIFIISLSAYLTKVCVSPFQVDCLSKFYISC